MIVPDSVMCPIRATFDKRDFSGLKSTAESFKHWDTCMDNKTCKIVAIVGIVLASIVAIWLVGGLLRCFQSGASGIADFCCWCFSCCRSSPAVDQQQMNKPIMTYQQQPYQPVQQPYVPSAKYTVQNAYPQQGYPGLSQPQVIVVEREAEYFTEKESDEDVPVKAEPKPKKKESELRPYVLTDAEEEHKRKTDIESGAYAKHDESDHKSRQGRNTYQEVPPSDSYDQYNKEYTHDADRSYENPTHYGYQSQTPADFTQHQSYGYQGSDSHNGGVSAGYTSPPISGSRAADRNQFGTLTSSHYEPLTTQFAPQTSGQYTGVSAGVNPYSSHTGTESYAGHNGVSFSGSGMPSGSYHGNGNSGVNTNGAINNPAQHASAAAATTTAATATTTTTQPSRAPYPTDDISEGPSGVSAPYPTDDYSRYNESYTHGRY